MNRGEMNVGKKSIPAGESKGFKESLAYSRNTVKNME